jgi:Purple acid Phosphatase, N-terminal domain/Calcineurin-like phosphoesterase
MSLAEQHEWFRRATSRRALLRGGAIGAGAAIAGPALLAGPASAAVSARQKATPALVTKGDWAPGSYLPPFGKHIAYGAEPTSQMSVAWQTAGPVSNPFIRVGTSPSGLSHQIGAEVRNLATPASVWNSSTASPVDSIAPSLSSATIEQYYVHAQLSGLQPGTTYYYSLGHHGWDHGDVAGQFTTAPRGRVPFTFTAFGDQGVTYDAVGNTNLIRAQNPAFHLHAGDISYAESGGSGLITDPYDPRVWDAWFTEVENAAASIPWNAVVGNHEMEPWYSPDGYGGQFARFDFPGGAAQTYYSFTYGNVGFIALDANDVSYELPANLGYSGGAQATWLGKQLSAWRQTGSGIDFIVVYFHHCAYCTCSTHGSDGGVDKVFVPLFDQYTVDLVINGHNHIYERTDPIIGGSATREAPIGSVLSNGGSSPAGTTYITAGGAGKSLYGFDGNSASPPGFVVPDSYLGNVNNDDAVPTYINSNPTTGAVTNDTVSWSRVRYTGYCLLVIDSEPSRFAGGTSKLKIRGLDEQGGLLDYLELDR